MAFGTGFTPDKPSADDVASIGVRLAIVDGVRKGVENLFVQRVEEALAGPTQVADTVAEAIANAVNDPIGDGFLVQEAVTKLMNDALAQALLPITDTAISLGFRPKEEPKAAVKRRRRKRPDPQTDDPTGGDLRLPYDPPINVPPNVETIDPAYLIIVNCKLGLSAAIPGLMTADLAQSGWVAVAQAGQLKGLSQGDLAVVWDRLVFGAGCYAQGQASRPVAPAVPRPNIPPVQLPVPGVQIPAAGGGIRVAGAGEELPEEEPGLSGGIAAGPAPTVPMAGGASPSALLPEQSQSGIPLDWWVVQVECDGTPAYRWTVQAPGVRDFVATQGRRWLGAWGFATRPELDAFIAQHLAGQTPPPEYGCVQAVPPLPAQPAPGAVPPLPAQPAPGAVPPIAAAPPGAVPAIAPPGGAVPPFAGPRMPPGALPLGPIALPPIGLGGGPGGSLPRVPGPGGPTPGWLLPFPPQSPCPACPACGAPIELPPAPPGGPPGSIPPLSPVPSPIPPAAPIGPPPGVLPISAQPSGGGSPCPPPVINVQLPTFAINVQCPQCGEINPVVMPSPLPSQPPAETEPVATALPPLLSGLPGALLAATSPPPPPPPPSIPGYGQRGPLAQQANEGDLETILARCLPGREIIEKLAGKSVYQLLRAAGALDETGQWTFLVPLWEKASADKGFVGEANRAGLRFIDALLSVLGHAAEWLQNNYAKVSGCGTPDAATSLVVNLLIGVVQRWIAHVPHAVTAVWETYARWACPVELPRSEWANEALAKGRISRNDWRCLVRASGDAEKWQDADMEMRKEMISAEQLLLLERRGKIAFGDTANYQLEQMGWTNKLHRDYLRASQQWVPEPSEAIEWMLKDLGDPVLSQTFGLFNEFNLKYQGRIKRALDEQGISEEDARYLAAAHWRPIAPHQLYEMHKRLRPGWERALSGDDALRLARAIAPRRPRGAGAQLEIEQVAQFLKQQSENGLLYGSQGTPAQLGYPDPPPMWLEDIVDERQARAYLAEATTTGFHVYESLSQSAYPPFWRARLMAISYNVLTRVDIRRAYETGQIDLETLVSLLQDRGYTPVDAERLGGFYREAAIQLAARRPAATEWVKTGFDQELLRQTLLDNGMRADMWEEVYRRLKTRRQIYTQTKCLTSLKKQYVAGTILDDSIPGRVTSIGLHASAAQELVEQWSCEKRAVPRTASASEIHKLHYQEILTDDDAKRLLKRLGYTSLQVSRMMSSWRYTKPPKTWLKRPKAEEAIPNEIP